MSTPPKPFAFTSGVRMLSLQRHLQTLELDILLGHVVALDHRVDRRVRRLHGVLQALQEGMQEFLDDFGLLGGEFRIHDDRVAIEIDAVIGHQHHGDVVGRNAAVLQVDVGREREAGDGIDLAGRQHRLAHREADILDRDLGRIDVVGLGEDLPLRIGAVRGRRAELLAFEILRIHGTAALAADNRKRRLVVDHEDGLDRHVRIGVAELDQRIDVAEADVVGAGRDAVQRLERAAGGVDRDVETFGLVIALVGGDQERRRRALEFPVEREFHRRLRSGGAAGDSHCGGGQQGRPPERFHNTNHLLVLSRLVPSCAGLGRRRLWGDFSGSR